MPTTPKYASKIYSELPTGVNIMNIIRAGANSEYRDLVPEATRNNIEEVADPIMRWEPNKNSFIHGLINMIGYTYIESRMWNNPLSRFKMGYLSAGDTVQEIVANIIKAEPFYTVDNQGMTAAEDLNKQRIPDVRAMYHEMNRQDKFPVSISNDQLRQAFTSYEGVERLTADILQMLYTSDNTEEFVLMKNLFVQAANRGALKPITVPDPTTSKENAQQAISIIRETAINMTFNGTKYNPMGSTGLYTHTPFEDQIILLSSKFASVVDVTVLAQSFHMNEADFIGNRVLLDDFGGLEELGVVAIVVDRRFFQVWDVYFELKEHYNGARLYWNYFLHHWQIMSFSMFRNAVAYVTTAPIVNTVTVTPATASVINNAEIRLQLSAIVDGTGMVGNGVNWTLDNAAITNGANVDTTGLLIIPAGFPAGTITATAASVIDSTKTGTAVITVSNPT